VRQHVEGLVLEALGVPVTDTNGNVTDILEEEAVTDTCNGNITETMPQATAPRRGGRPGVLRRPIIDLLQKQPEGLTAVAIKVHLGTQKNVGDTLAGMVRDHVIDKQGSGKEVRYLPVAAQGQATAAGRH
jgi:hypothetical protein